METTGGEAYAKLIEVELVDQRAVKESLERRAGGVITTSGVLVTLLFGLGSVITQRNGYALPNASVPWLYVSLGAFVAAALTALVVSVPLRYRAPTVPALNKLLTEPRWGDSPADAVKRIAATHVVVLAAYRKGNSLKAWALLAAISSEVVAVLCLAVAVGIVFYDR